MMKKHFVIFMSPGTFVSEVSERPIDDWDARAACKMAESIEERHGAKPYGFRFSTRLCAPPVEVEGESLDVQPKEIASSGMHYITGEAIRFDDVPVDKEHDILRSNMRCNRHPVIIENRNSYRFSTFFSPADVIVDRDGKIIRRGNDPDLVEYRTVKIAEWEAK